MGSSSGRRISAASAPAPDDTLPPGADRGSSEEPPPPQIIGQTTRHGGFPDKRAVKKPAAVRRTYQVSIKPGASGATRAEARPRTSQERVSAGSITASISSVAAMCRASPLAY